MNLDKQQAMILSCFLSNIVIRLYSGFASMALSKATGSIEIYLLKVNNRNTRTMCEICSKLTIKTPEWRHWCLSGVFIVNFEHISHLFQLFLLLKLNMKLPAFLEIHIWYRSYLKKPNCSITSTNRSLNNVVYIKLFMDICLQSLYNLNSKGSSFISNCIYFKIYPSVI